MNDIEKKLMVLILKKIFKKLITIYLLGEGLMIITLQPMETVREFFYSMMTKIINQWAFMIQ